MASVLLVLVSLLPFDRTVYVDLVEINTTKRVDGTIRCKQTIFWKRYEDGFHVVDFTCEHLDVVPHGNRWRVFHPSRSGCKIIATRYWRSTTLHDPERADSLSGWVNREGLFYLNREFKLNRNQRAFR